MSNKYEPPEEIDFMVAGVRLADCLRYLRNWPVLTNEECEAIGVGLTERREPHPMESESIVERVKAAIEKIGGDDALDQMNPDYDKNLTAIARAAISAMREEILAIEARADAKFRRPGQYDDGSADEEFSVRVRELFDAALK